MTVYHGSNKKFAKFEQQFLQNGGLYGTGAYLSTVDEAAKSYGNYLYTCEIPDTKYIIGDELNISLTQWRKICAKTYALDKYGFYNYGDYQKAKLLDLVARQLASHEFLVSAIFEFNSCVYSDMTDIQELLGDYVGIKMCNGSEVLVWNATDVKIKSVKHWQK